MDKSHSSKHTLKDAHSRHKLRELAQELMQRKQRGAGLALAAQRVLLHPLLDEQDLVPDGDEHVSLRHYELASKEISKQISQHRPWYMIDPDGLPRRLWDSGAAILIYALIFYLPFLTAYFDEACCSYLTFQDGTCKPDVGVRGHPQGKGWQLFVILTNWFFIFDIVSNFLTGWVETSGAVNYKFKTVCYYYLKGWFWVDIVACIPLECILQAAENVNFYNFGKMIRLVRAVGIRRRCRGNPFRWIDRLSDFRKEFSYSAQRLVVASFVTLTTLHYFACLVWLTIRVQHFPPTTWPQQQALLGETSVMEQYLWSLFCIVSAMIGLGYGAFPPRTWPEALVWCVCMVVMASMFAVINGFIVATILSNARGRHRYKERMDNVMAALKARHLPPQLYKRLLEYFVFRYQKAQVADDRDLWTELPYDLQAALALASTESLLSQIPLFAEDAPLLERVAMLLKPAYALAGEEILRQGWPATQIYFIRSGYVDLIMSKAVVDTLRDGDYFGEAALMELPSPQELQQHCGGTQSEVSHYSDMFTVVTSVRALTNCEMFVLEADDFREVVQDFPGACEQLRQAALRHAERLRSLGVKLGPARGTRTPSRTVTGGIDEHALDELLISLNDSLDRRQQQSPRASMMNVQFDHSPESSLSRRRSGASVDEAPRPPIPHETLATVLERRSDIAGPPTPFGSFHVAEP